MTPLKVYVFGVVNCATGKLSAFTYEEQEGAKGGNNVASLLYKQILQEVVAPPCVAVPSKPIKELNVVMDNCAGQNKNKMVMRLLTVLVKRGICKVANAIFLAKGHTKNPCDRMFNLLKKGYRKENMYTFKQVLPVLNQNRNVKAIPVTAEDFLDWDSWENEFMVRSIREIKLFHLFQVDASLQDANGMTKRRYDGTSLKAEWIVKQKYRKSDDWWWSTPKQAPKASISEMKVIDLYHKWRLLVPQQHWGDSPFFSEPPSLVKMRKKSQEAQKKRKAQEDKNNSNKRQKESGNTAETAPSGTLDASS